MSGAMEVAALPRSAQAAFGGVAAVLAAFGDARAGGGSGLSARRAYCLVAAAVRGATQALGPDEEVPDLRDRTGLNAAPTSVRLEEALQAVQQAAAMQIKPTVSEAKSLLAGRGATGRRLASKVGKLSKARNVECHPDVDLLDGINAVLRDEEDMSGDSAGSETQTAAPAWGAAPGVEGNRAQPGGGGATTYGKKGGNGTVDPRGKEIEELEQELQKSMETNAAAKATAAAGKAAAAAAAAAPAAGAQGRWAEVLKSYADYFPPEKVTAKTAAAGKAAAAAAAAPAAGAQGRRAEVLKSYAAHPPSEKVTAKTQELVQLPRKSQEKATAGGGPAKASADGQGTAGGDVGRHVADSLKVSKARRACDPVATRV